MRDVFRTTWAKAVTQYVIMTLPSPGSWEFRRFVDGGTIAGPNNKVDRSGDGENEEE